MNTDSGGRSPCPPPEDLAAFVDGKLRQDRRAHIEAHLADCEVCREMVADSALLAEERLPTRWMRSHRLAAGVVVALAASLMFVVILQPDLLRTGQQSPHAELVAAVGTNRTIEGRLTGGFAYAPLRPTTRTARAADENFELLAASSAVEARAVEQPTTSNRHAAAIARLVLGDHERAVSMLEAVVAEDPARASYLSDLAAAYLARGREWDRPKDFAKAKAAADRAIALDPSLDEAYFNRALALDALGRVREAEDAYRKALARDPRSPWNAELASRLEQLQRR